MAKYGLVSKYILRRKKRKKAEVNEDATENVVNREFDDRARYEVVISDLTYVKIGGIWHYLCLLVDLCGRKIIGSAIGRNKDAELVETAFYRVETGLSKIGVFHTDRGSEFKNKIIEDILKAFEIERSLSAKGTPLDNAVAESMYNIVKTECIYGETFESMEEFELYWFDWVNWYNNVRIHGSLDYLTPNEWHGGQRRCDDG